MVTKPEPVITVTLSPGGQLTLQSEVPLPQLLSMLLQLTEDVRMRRLRAELAAGVEQPRVVVPRIGGLG